MEDRVANLVSLLQARKSRLIEAARQTREARVRSLRDQVARCASHLQATTALLTFCIEALKENDSAAFLQIGGMLSVRAATAAGSWGGAEGVQEIARLPLLDLTLDDKPLRRAIDQLTFVQLKRKLSLSIYLSIYLFLIALPFPTLRFTFESIRFDPFLRFSLYYDPVDLLPLRFFFLNRETNQRLEHGVVLCNV